MSKIPKDLEAAISKARGMYVRDGVKYIGYKRHVYATHLGPVAIFKREEDDSLFYVALRTLEVLHSAEIAP